MNLFHINKPNEGEHLMVGSDIVTVKASSLHTSGHMLMVEVRVAPGGGPPALHRHESAEVFYILEGEFEVSTADDAGNVTKETLMAGDTLAIPSMAWHNFKNTSSSQGRILVVHSPTVGEAFLQAAGVPITDPLNPPEAQKPTPEQMERMKEAMNKYMEILRPQ
jgi:mannose-6-phosphate isomerase-like protein (cupin superfamily)